MNSLFWCCLAIASTPAGQPVHFDTEIIPVLTQAGCNSGACHGAAAGRGEFHLSLLGSNPSADYIEVTSEFEGRRINLARPEVSLLLAKPTGQMEHGGDIVVSQDGMAYQRLVAWIRAGAPRGAPRQLTQFKVIPARHRLAADQLSVPLQAIAQFDDGPEEDVTEWVTFTSTDPAAITIDGSRVAHCRRSGLHVMIARFLNRVEPVQLLVPYNTENKSQRYFESVNFIDEEIVATLRELGIPASEEATDEQFIRRVTLDLIGRLPDPKVVTQYRDQAAADKRSLYVAELLSSDAFADYRTLRWARLLQIHSLPHETEGVAAYVSWLHDQLADGTPLDRWARELITATGDAHQVGPANFGRMVADARGQAELVGRFFMGVRVGCANCHNHPLDRWTQDDYHGLAAVFARVERGRHVQLTARGAVTNLRTNEPAVPRLPGDRDIDGEMDARVEFARWITSRENPYFAKATVNRLWKSMFGRGLVEPADDMRETNPATHPTLLNQLADDFVQHDFDLRHTLARIALSNTYARSDLPVIGNAMDDRFYSHAMRRPLGPEVLADAIADVTGIPNEYDGQLPGTRAIAIVDPLMPAPTLDILGRCHRATACDDGETSSGSVAASLHLLNGPLINAKLTHAQGRLRQLIAEKKTDGEIVNEFYLRVYSRSASDPELLQWTERLKAATSEARVEQLEDFVWGILNSRDFRENH